MVFDLAVKCYDQFRAANANSRKTSRIYIVSFTLSQDKDADLFDYFGESFIDDATKNSLAVILGDHFGLAVEVMRSKVNNYRNQFHVRMKY
jgi:hypothetical protein